MVVLLLPTRSAAGIGAPGRLYNYSAQTSAPIGIREAHKAASEEPTQFRTNKTRPSNRLSLSATVAPHIYIYIRPYRAQSARDKRVGRYGHARGAHSSGSASLSLLVSMAINAKAGSGASVARLSLMNFAVCLAALREFCERARERIRIRI